MVVKRVERIVEYGTVLFCICLRAELQGLLSVEALSKPMEKALFSGSWSRLVSN